jgi:hypothetical protein
LRTRALRATLRVQGFASEPALSAGSLSRFAYKTQKNRQLGIFTLFESLV